MLASSACGYAADLRGATWHAALDARRIRSPDRAWSPRGGRADRAPCRRVGPQRTSGGSSRDRGAARSTDFAASAEKGGVRTMKWCRFRSGDKPAYGIIEGNGVVEV